MDAKQKKAIDANRSDLIEALSQPAVIDHLMQTLEENGVINLANRQLLNREHLDRDKIMRLLEILKWKGQGWSALIAFITDQGYDPLVTSLSTAAGVTTATAANRGVDQSAVAASSAKELLRRQNAVLQLNSDGLCAALHPDLIIPELQKSGLIEWSKAQIVNSEITDEKKVMSLLHQMATNNKFYDAVIAFLTKHHATVLRDKIVKDLQECL